MLEIKETNADIAQNLIDIIPIDYLPFKEYKCINLINIKNYYLLYLIEQSISSESYNISLYDNKNLVGLLICNLNKFDSHYFGFNCYNITDLIILSDKYDKIQYYCKALVKNLENHLQSKQQKYYLSIGINNSHPNNNLIFNAIVNCGFFFIHTLITFAITNKYYINKSDYYIDNINIRLVRESDVDEIAKLASKSFYFSRFHLDPYLDKDDANKLLKDSAINSIINHYVDVMYVAECEGKIIGYYSGKKQHINSLGISFGKAIISAVNDSYRGKGIFSLLDAWLLNWFIENTTIAEMGTYLANYPVHRTWIKKKIPLVKGTYQLSKIST